MDKEKESSRENCSINEDVRFEWRKVRISVPHKVLMRINGMDNASESKTVDPNVGHEKEQQQQQNIKFDYFDSKMFEIWYCVR